MSLPELVVYIPLIVPLSQTSVRHASSPHGSEEIGPRRLLLMIPN